MLKLLIASTLISCAIAGYGSRNSGSFGSIGGSYGSGMSSGYSSGSGSQVVQAAIQSHHEIQYKDVPSTGFVHPTTIEVGAGQIPLNIIFRSASSNLNIQQVHEGAQGSTQESQSEDEPHILKHSVTKPIIQEVNEIITPYRKISTEIKPVEEEILTIVSRQQEQRSSRYGDKSSGSFSAKGYY